MLAPTPVLVERLTVPEKYGALPVSVTSSLSPVPGLVTVACMPETPSASVTLITADPLGQVLYVVRSNATWPTWPPAPHDAPACAFA